MEPQIAVPLGATSYLMADITEAAAVFTTDAGEQKVAIRGSIGFELTQAPRRKTSVSLIRLNLVTEGVKTKSGHSGVLGLMLAKQPVPIKYDPSKGGLEAAFDLVLHYPLIDQKLGFKEKRVKEDTCFVPYTETMAARLAGHLPRLAPDEKGHLSIDFELKAELSQTY